MTNGNDTINAVVQTSTDPFGGERMECTDGGLTKREYFAAMAMQGMSSYCKLDGFKGIYEQLAKQSVWAADALIEQLNKQQQVQRL